MVFNTKITIGIFIFLIHVGSALLCILQVCGHVHRGFLLMMCQHEIRLWLVSRVDIFTIDSMLAFPHIVLLEHSYTICIGAGGNHNYIFTVIYAWGSYDSLFPKKHSLTKHTDIDKNDIDFEKHFVY